MLAEDSEISEQDSRSEISEQDVSHGDETQNDDFKSESESDYELDTSSQERFHLDAEAHECHDEHLRFLEF